MCTFLLSGKDEAEGETLIGNGSPKILVERSLFTQKTFDEAFEPGSRPSPTIKQRAKRKISKYNCSGRCCKDFLFMLFPFLAIMKNYKIREDLMGDVISGLTVGIMHIPQGKCCMHIHKYLLNYQRHGCQLQKPSQLWLVINYRKLQALTD